MRPWLLLSAALVLATGCPTDEDPPATADDDDGGSSTGNTTDPSTTLPPTTDPTFDPTSTTDPTDSSTGTGDPTTGEPTTGEPTTGTESSTGPGDESSGGSSSSTGEPCEFILCDGECVDPDTNADYCGAMDDCVDENAGVVCSGSASCEAGECVESCENCSFETGDFTGWTVSDMAVPFNPAAVLMTGTDPLEADPFGFGVVTATDGDFVGYNGFDGEGPDTIEFGQDIAIREGATTLEFDYRIAWDLMSFSMGALDRVFEVHIEPEGGGDPLDTILIDTAISDMIGDSGLAMGSVDVSTYGGQTVFVNFVWDVPEPMTGPAHAELDNVRVLVE